MVDSDYKRFAYVMGALGEAFSQEVSKVKIEIYFKAMQDLKIEEIEAASWNIINNRGTATFPKVAEIRTAIHGNPDDVAQLALEKVEKAIREVGGYRTVVFDDPVIHIVINTFNDGWPGICALPIDEWKFRRKDFIKSYMANQRNFDYYQPLKGLFEIQNSEKGFKHESEKPVMIGDKKKIEKLLAAPENKDFGKLLEIGQRLDEALNKPAADDAVPF